MGAAVPGGADNRKVSEQRADAALHAECKNNPQGLESTRRLVPLIIHEPYESFYKKNNIFLNK